MHLSTSKRTPPALSHRGCEFYTWVMLNMKLDSFLKGRLFVQLRSNVIHPFHQTAHFCILIPYIFLCFGSDNTAQTNQSYAVGECHTSVQYVSNVPNYIQCSYTAYQYNKCPNNTERHDGLNAAQVYPTSFTIVRPAQNCGCLLYTSHIAAVIAQVVWNPSFI